MKVGDLVVLRGKHFSSWAHTNENAVVVEVPDACSAECGGAECDIRDGCGCLGLGGSFVMFGGGDVKDYSGYEDHFEVINESW